MFLFFVCVGVLKIRWTKVETPWNSLLLAGWLNWMINLTYKNWRVSQLFWFFNAFFHIYIYIKVETWKYGSWKWWFLIYNLLFQGFIFRFHVSFPGCMYFFWLLIGLTDLVFLSFSSRFLDELAEPLVERIWRMLVARQGQPAYPPPPT